MPTPMPIIAANWAVKLGMGTNCAPTLTRKNPDVRPTIAVMIGRPMATSEPNASSRMMIAALMPISSELPGGSPSNCSITRPPASASNPAVRVSSRTSNSAFSSLRSRSFARTSYWTLMRAILPSPEMSDGVSAGFETSLT